MMSVDPPRAEPALQLHDRGEVLHAEEIAGVVDPGDEIESLRGHLLQAARLQHAGVAHQDVQAAERLHALPRQGLQRGGAGHVGGHEQRPVRGARCLRGGIQLALQAAARRLVQIRDDDVGPFPEEAFRDPLAETLRGAGDQRRSVPGPCPGPRRPLFGALAARR